MAGRKKAKTKANPQTTAVPEILKSETTAGTASENVRDKESVKQLFMESPHLSWAPFAESIGLHPHRSLNEYPTNLWRAEKRKKIIDQEKDRLKDEVAQMMGPWSADVRNTLKKYPQVADAALSLIVEKIRVMQDDVQADNEKRDGKSDRRKKWDAQTLSTLASAINTITQAKHRALMIDQFAVDLPAMMDSVGQVPQEASVTDTPRAIEVVIKTMPAERNDGHQATEHQEMLASYYDFNKAKTGTLADEQLPKGLLPSESPAQDDDELDALMREADAL